MPGFNAKGLKETEEKDDDLEEEEEEWGKRTRYEQEEADEVEEAT